MNYEIGASRSVQIEWQYGLAALAAMAGFELPKGLYPEFIPSYADWSKKFNTGRVLQLAMSGSRRNLDWPDPRPELIFDEFTYHVSETTDVALVPFCFEVPRGEGGNVLATRIGHLMHDADYRPATLTEILWYAAKYQDEIGENQILVPWVGYSGGFGEGRQLHNHLGLPFVVRHKGVLKLVIQEFLGQHMSVGQGVQYLAVKL